MKRLRRGLFALLSLTVLISAGCSTEGTGGGDDASASAVAQAREALEGAESCRVVFTSRMGYTVTREADEAEDTLDVEQVMDMTVITAPEVRIKREQTTHMETGSGESHDTGYTIYMVKEDGEYWNYGTSGEEWYKAAMEGDAMDEVELGSLTEIFSADESSYRRLGEETVEGVETVKYQGTIRGEAVADCIERMGLLTPISNMSESQQEKIRANLANMEGFPVYVWLAKEDGRPVRYETEVTRETLDELSETVSQTLGGYEIEDWDGVRSAGMSMTVSEYNSAPEIVLPPEAKDAELVDESMLSGEETDPTGGETEAPAVP